MPLSPSFPPNLVCRWVCGWVGGCASACLCMWVSEWVCLLYPSIFIFSSSFCFWLMIIEWFLVVFVLEMRMILFLLLFVSFCCIHLYFMFTAVSYQIFCHWCSFIYPHWGFWNKLLDLLGAVLGVRCSPYGIMEAGVGIARHPECTVYSLWGRQGKIIVRLFERTLRSLRGKRGEGVMLSTDHVTVMLSLCAGGG